MRASSNRVIFGSARQAKPILQLDAKLFFTHRGIEKAVEGKTPAEALLLVERVCGSLFGG